MIVAVMAHNGPGPWVANPRDDTITIIVGRAHVWCLSLRPGWRTDWFHLHDVEVAEAKMTQCEHRLNRPKVSVQVHQDDDGVMHVSESLRDIAKQLGMSPR